MLLVALDTETTGVDPLTAELVQLGVVSMCERTKDMNILINSKCFPESGVIPAEASQIHGLYIEDLVYCPRADTLVKVVSGAIEQLQDIVLVSYNGEFYDFPILERYGGNLNYRHIDVYRLVQRGLWRYGLKLSEVHKGYLGKPLEGAHDAIADVIGTLNILAKYMQETGNTALEVCEYLASPMILEYVFFGRYKGTKFSKVPSGYLWWIKNNWESLNPDMQVTLEHYL